MTISEFRKHIQEGVIKLYLEHLLEDYKKVTKEERSLLENHIKKALNKLK